jgi:hypothetical protein
MDIVLRMVLIEVASHGFLTNAENTASIDAQPNHDHE